MMLLVTRGFGGGAADVMVRGFASVEYVVLTPDSRKIVIPAESRTIEVK